MLSYVSYILSYKTGDKWYYISRCSNMLLLLYNENKLCFSFYILILISIWILLCFFFCLFLCFSFPLNISYDLPFIVYANVVHFRLIEKNMYIIYMYTCRSILIRIFLNIRNEDLMGRFPRQTQNTNKIASQMPSHLLALQKKRKNNIFPFHWERTRVGEK